MHIWDGDGVKTMPRFVYLPKRKYLMVSGLWVNYSRATQKTQSIAQQESTIFGNKIEVGRRILVDPCKSPGLGLSSFGMRYGGHLSQQKSLATLRCVATLYPSRNLSITTR